jgi:hypothetical protein
MKKEREDEQVGPRRSFLGFLSKSALGVFFLLWMTLGKPSASGAPQRKKEALAALPTCNDPCPLCGRPCYLETGAHLHACARGHRWR